MIKRLLVTVIMLIGATTASADIPYCPGTSVADGKHQALQSVITQFATENDCKLSNNCILNFDGVKYSIAWAAPCSKSAKLGNDPNGSTFICIQGVCKPLGFDYPTKFYKEKNNCRY